MKMAEWLKKAIWLVGKLVLIVSLMGVFVTFDDWFSKRTDLDIYPSSIRLDSTQVQYGRFELEANELETISRLEHTDNHEMYLASISMIRTAAVMGGSFGSATEVNLYSIVVAEQFLMQDIVRDSILLRTKAYLNKAANDSVSQRLAVLQQLRDGIVAIRTNHLADVRDRVCVAITVTVENSSSAQTALLEPGLLVVEFEGGVIEVKLTLTGAETEMSMFGLKFQSGKASTIIFGASLKQLTFKTETKEALGNKWNDIIAALGQPTASGKVRFITIDGTLVESGPFAFSEDYYDQFVKDRLKSLKRP